MKFKKFMCLTLSSLFLTTTIFTVPTLASDITSENTQNIELKSSIYSIEDVKKLEPYVKVNDGKFSLDVESALKDGFDKKLLDIQKEYFNLLNELSSNGDIIINNDLSIENTGQNTSTTYIAEPENYTHKYNCNGGLLSSTDYHWWGYTRYFCDCGTSQFSSDLATVSDIYGGVAVVSGAFGNAPITTVAGISSAYWSLVSNRLNANNKGKGVYAEMTNALLFDITPQ